MSGLPLLVLGYLSSPIAFVGIVSCPCLLTPFSAPIPLQLPRAVAEAIVVRCEYTTRTPGYYDENSYLYLAYRRDIQPLCLT